MQPDACKHCTISVKRLSNNEKLQSLAPLVCNGSTRCLRKIGPACCGGITDRLLLLPACCGGITDRLLLSGLFEFYTEHNPSKATAEHVDMTLARYVGRSTELLIQLQHKYNVRVPPHAAVLSYYSAMRLMVVAAVQYRRWRRCGVRQLPLGAPSRYVSNSLRPHNPL